MLFTVGRRGEGDLSRLVFLTTFKCLRPTDLAVLPGDSTGLSGGSPGGGETGGGSDPEMAAGVLLLVGML